MRHKRGLALLLLAMLAAFLLAIPAMASAGDAVIGGADSPTGIYVTGAADDGAVAEATTISGKAIACGIAIGIAAAGGAIGMGLVSGKATEGIARQPEAEGKIRTTLMLGLVFIETAIIYALLVVILVIFVL